MIELNEALRQIAEIRSQMARDEVFRGFRSATVGASGVLAVLAAAAQPWLVPAPEADLGRYLALWVGVAVASLVAAGVEMAREANAGLARQKTRLALEQFSPSLVVGGLLTFCIVRAAPGSAWLLPGLWALVFSLGVFATRHLLPRPVVWVGAYYVLGGCLCLARGPADAFAPWQMGLTFGGGQLLGAAILRWTLERDHGSQN